MIGSNEKWTKEQVELMHEIVAKIRKYPHANPVFLIYQLLQNGEIIHQEYLRPSECVCGATSKEKGSEGRVEEKVAHRATESVTGDNTE